MINIKIGLILLSIPLFVLVSIFVIKEEFRADATLDNLIFNKTDLEKLNFEKIHSAIISQNSTEPEETELNFRGKVLTCTNKTYVGHIIDVRLSNLDVENKSITIYPLNLTINLLPEQIKRTDIFLPDGISTLKLVSSDGEEEKVQVPPCVNGYEGSTTTQTTNLKVNEIPEFPSIGLPVITILVFLFVMKKTN